MLLPGGKFSWRGGPRPPFHDPEFGLHPMVVGGHRGILSGKGA